MKNRKYNEKAINDVYKNAHLALQSINDILPQVKDEKLIAELKEQYDGYDKIIENVTAFMKRNGIKPKDANVFKKAMMWCAIKMKSGINNSENQIADMMIKGTVMGINELAAMRNEKDNLDERVAKFVEDLLTLEEEYQQRWKKYL